MKKLLASLGLGLFVVTSIPPVLAARETVFGTMDECETKQTELVASFRGSLADLEKSAKTNARESKLVQAYRKRLARQKKITPELQKVIDDEEAWVTKVSDTFQAHLEDQWALLEKICSTSPATIKTFWVNRWMSEVELDTDYVAYLGWLEANADLYKKTVPLSFFRKRQKMVKGKTEAEAELSEARKMLAEANALSTTSFE